MLYWHNIIQTFNDIDPIIRLKTQAYS